MPDLSPEEMHRLHRALEKMHTLNSRSSGLSLPPVLGGYAPYIAVGVIIWVVSIVLSDRLADDLFLNPWVGRLIGFCFPVLGPLVLYIVRIRTRII